MSLIDLTQPLSPTTPVYPGDPKVEVQSLSCMENEVCMLHQITMSLHAGTHMDAPAHFVKGGKLLSDLPLEAFVGNGVLIDCRDNAGVITLSHLDQKPIRSDDIVLFWTGWDEFYGQEKYFESHPVISEEVANKLVQLGVKWVGLDTPSPDRHPYPIHNILLPEEVLIVENLTSLDSLCDYEKFQVTAFPLRLPYDGSPVRVVANLHV